MVQIISRIKYNSVPEIIKKITYNIKFKFLGDLKFVDSFFKYLLDPRWFWKKL